jgi:homoserine kinase type II
MPTTVPDAVLRAFELAGATTTQFERGLINRHWLATDGERRVVLRQYNQLRSKEGIRWEQALVERAADAHWPVPRPLASNTGQLVFEHGRSLWAAAPFLEGEPQAEPGPAMFNIVGRLLGRLHHDLAGFETEGQRPGFGKTWELDAWIAPAGVGSFNEVLARFSSEYSELGATIRGYRYRNLRELSRLHYPDLPDLPVHGDFQRSNLLWQEGQLTGLLDFDFARRDALACDLAVLLVPFEPLETRLARALFEGYGTVRELSEIEWALLPSLARAHLLLWVALLLVGWRTGANPTAVASIERTMTLRLPALEAAEAGFLQLRRNVSERR